MIENAPTFHDEANDPDQLAFELDWISGFAKPVLLTLGDQSPPTFAPVVTKLSGALPHAEVVTLLGAGHVPYATHPDAYVEAVIEFTRRHAA
jgi:pimeloyl-ACP methyl ester carboxylesterase